MTKIYLILCGVGNEPVHCSQVLCCVTETSEHPAWVHQEGTRQMKSCDFPHEAGTEAPWGSKWLSLQVSHGTSLRQ